MKNYKINDSDKPKAKHTNSDHFISSHQTV